MVDLVQESRKLRDVYERYEKIPRDGWQTVNEYILHYRLES
jgi:hypothetical protein